MYYNIHRTKRKGNKNMRTWNELTDYEQVNLWWEYLATCDEDEHLIFAEFAEMMEEAGITFG